jgi:hypothetical protein
VAKKILIVLVVVVVGFLGFAATRPDTYSVERSMTISAPVEVAFDYVNDLEKRHEWYPWDRMDPDLKITYGAAKAGKGASNHWVGNDKVGEGKQEIVESIANQKVVDKLEFIKPMTGASDVTFTFAPDGAGTKVTWRMDGHNDFVGKIFSVFMNFDKMIGPDFESGLRNLNEVATAETARRAEAKAKEEAAKAAATPPPAEGDAAPAGEAPPAKG